MARQFAIGGKKMLQETLAHNRIRGERRACHKMNTTTKEKMKTKQDSLTHSSSSSCSCNHVLSWTQEKSREKKQNRKTKKRMTSLKRTNTKKERPKSVQGKQRITKIHQIKVAGTHRENHKEEELNRKNIATKTKVNFFGGETANQGV